MKYSNILSILVSYKRQTSMRRRFIVFSSVLFLLIFAVGSTLFIILMNQIMHKNAGHEIMHTVEMKRFELEASINSEIAIAVKMAGSPLIQRYFLNPADSKLEEIALDEIAGYRRAFAENNVFWISDIDKKYYFNDEYVYTLDPANESSWWYNEIMGNPTPYSLTVNFDVGIKETMLWIDTPVLDDNHKPVGIVGTGVNMTDFINAIYQNYLGVNEELYFFKSTGEISGAKDIALAENRVKMIEALGQTGEEILAISRELRSKEIKYFETKDNGQIIAVGYIPALDWYITAVRSFTIADSLNTGMTVLFGVIIAVIFLIFLVFNIFIIGMLEPLNRMVKTIIQTLSDLDLKPQENWHYKNEIETLGEFFHLTIIDQLTGIYNRRYFESSLKKIIKSHSRADSNLSVLMIDVDYFKKYNDAYGHDAGDGCLRAVAVALSQCAIRDGDFVARYGGEEFAAVLPNTCKNGAQVVAEKMLRKVRELNISHKASDIADYVTISVGGTTGVVKHSQNSQDYIKAADKALYESKKKDRNRYTFGNFDEIFIYQDLSGF